MTRRFRPVSCLAFILTLAVANLTAASIDPDKDPSLPKLLEDARTLIKRKQPREAIANCDKIITLFKQRYEHGDEKVYCARSSTETLGYLLQAGADINKGQFGKGKNKAIVLSDTWANAYFVKGYALQDVGRVAEAKAALKLALELSPWNS